VESLGLNGGQVHRLVEAHKAGQLGRRALQLAYGLRCEFQVAVVAWLGVILEITSLDLQEVVDGSLHLDSRHDLIHFLLMLMH
jgi:hypothetical protein